MANIYEKKQLKLELIGKQKALLDQADDEKRSLTAKEDEEFKKLDSQVDALDREIIALERDMERSRKLAMQEIESRKLAGQGAARGDGEDGPQETAEYRAAVERLSKVKGFQVRGDSQPEREFWAAFAANDTSALRESRAGLKIGSGPSGGYLVPEVTKIGGLDRMWANQGIIGRLSREIVEGGDVLNVSTFEANDIDAHGLFGFSKAQFSAEGATLAEETPRVVKRSWALKKLSTTTKISVEAAAVANLGRKVEDAIAVNMAHAIEYYVVQGSGAAEPQGIINAPCAVTYNRAGAGAIAYTDCVGMLAQTRLSPSCCWLASQTVIPQLAAMVDAGSHAVWLPAVSGGAVQGVPQSLLGYPIYFSLDVNPTLGSRGDLIFGDLSAIKLVVFTDLLAQRSDSAYWTTAEIGVRILMLCDVGALPNGPVKAGGETFGWFTVLE